MLCYLYSYYPKQYRPPDFSQKMPFRLKYVKWTVRLSTVTQRTEILQEDFPNLAPGEASLRSIRRPALEADRDGKGMIPRLTSITNTKFPASSKRTTHLYYFSKKGIRFCIFLSSRNIWLLRKCSTF